MGMQGQVIDLWGSFAQGVEMAGRAQERANQREASIWDRQFREEDLSSRERMHGENLENARALQAQQLDFNKWMQEQKIRAEFQQLAATHGFAWDQMNEEHRLGLIEMAHKYGIDTALTELSDKLIAKREGDQRTWQSGENVLDRNFKEKTQLRDIGWDMTKLGATLGWDREKFGLTREHDLLMQERDFFGRKKLQNDMLRANRSGFFLQKDGRGFRFGDPADPAFAANPELLIAPQDSNVWDRFTPSSYDTGPQAPLRAGATEEDRQNWLSEENRRAHLKKYSGSYWGNRDLNPFMFETPRKPNALRGAIDLLAPSSGPPPPGLQWDAVGRKYIYQR